MAEEVLWGVGRSLFFQAHSCSSDKRTSTLVADDIEAAIRGLEARRGGVIDVPGPGLARGLTDLGLIDEDRLHIHPFVLGRGAPYPHRAAGAAEVVSWPAGSAPGVG